MSKAAKKEEEIIEKTEDEIIESIFLGGMAYSAHQGEATYINQHKFRGINGHGFAAEQQAHINDVLSLNQAEVLGDSNIKNGPDRLVNGIEIQTKCCQSAQETVADLFRDGSYRYFDSSTGRPMPTEVPKEQYREAINLMKGRISRGEVPGVSDTNEAENLIREGSFTYRQATNIAKAGNIDSIIFDIKTGAVICVAAFGMSAVISFAFAKYHGKSNIEASKIALSTASKVFGMALVTHVGTQQLLRMSATDFLNRPAIFLTQQFSKEAQNTLAALAKKGFDPSKHNATTVVSRSFKTNIISGVIITGLLSAKDITYWVKGEISGAQCFKNVVVNGGGVAAGIAGAKMGALAPVPPQFKPVTAFLGGMFMGFGGQKLLKGALDLISEDDAVKLRAILEAQLVKVVEDFMLTKDELERLGKKIKEIKWDETIRKMYKANDSEDYAYKIFEVEACLIARGRKKISFAS